MVQEDTMAIGNFTVPAWMRGKWSVDGYCPTKPYQLRSETTINDKYRLSTTGGTLEATKLDDHTLWR